MTFPYRFAFLLAQFLRFTVDELHRTLCPIGALPHCGTAEKHESPPMATGLRAHATPKGGLTVTEPSRILTVPSSVTTS